MILKQEHKENEMSNMSYCRFENTLHALEDCQDALDNRALNKRDEMSEHERPCVAHLIKLCKEIADDYYEEIEE